MPNPDGTKLEVVIFDKDGDIVAQFFDADDSAEVEPDGEAVDYVSLVTGDTYGKPALVAPGKPGDARAQIGDTVLYINNSLVPFYTVTRVPGN